MKFLIFLTLVQATIVYLIRHAEKPKFKSNALSITGKKRAQCLASIFTNQYKPPKRIIAQPPRGKYRSRRPLETVKPLSSKLGLTIELDCLGNDIDCVVKSIHGDGPILISWEHKRLSKIVKHFLKKAPKYPHDRYDLIWILDTESGTIKEEVQDCKKEKLDVVETTVKPVDSLLGNFTPSSSIMERVFYCFLLLPFLL